MNKIVLWSIIVLLVSCQGNWKDSLPINSEQLIRSTLLIDHEMFTHYGEKTIPTRTSIPFTLNNVWLFQFDGDKLLHKERIAYNVQAGSSLYFSILPSDNCTLYLIGNLIDEQATDRIVNLETLQQAQCNPSMKNDELTPYLVHFDNLKVADDGTLTQNNIKIQSCNFFRITARIELQLTFNVPDLRLLDVTYHCSPQSLYYLYSSSYAQNQMIQDTVINPHVLTNDTYVWFVAPNLGGENQMITAVEERNHHNIPREKCGFIRIRARNNVTNRTINYDLYVGKNHLTNFDIESNGNYYYQVTLNKGETLIPTDGRVSGDEGIIELSAYGRYANCYICRTEDTYRFDATVMGNGSMEDGNSMFIADNNGSPINLKPYKAVLLWETTADAITEKARKVIDGLPRLSGNFIEFRTGNVEGNAVIGIQDQSGKLIWSWHIWVTNKHTEQASHKGYMFYNLGATHLSTFDKSIVGLLYQWGRKDPFLPLTLNDRKNLEVGDGQCVWNETTVADFSSRLANIYTSIQKPTTLFASYNTGIDINYFDWYFPGFQRQSQENQQLTQIQHNSQLWGGIDGKHKTIFDPCPYGWRVPSKDPATIFESVPLGYNRLDDNSGLYPIYRCIGASSGYALKEQVLYWTTTQLSHASAIMPLPDDITRKRTNGLAIRCIRDE